MKIISRVFLILLGVLVAYYGIQQIRTGVGELTGKPVLVPQEPGDRVTVAAHACSLRVPRGWEQTPMEGGNGVKFVAPKASGYTANFNVLSDPFAGSLDEYAEATISAVKAAVPAAVLGAKVPFGTDSGVASLKLPLRQKVKDVEVAQILYLFEGQNGRKMVLTSSTTATQLADMEKLFDACMKTLAIEGK